MKQILIRWGIFQSCAVVLNNGEPEDVLTEDSGVSFGVGNLYRARVENVVAGTRSAFLDIGDKKNAFLFSDDVAPAEADISAKIKKGQELTVQIVKEASGTKGARVTTEVMLPGHLLVLMPTLDYVGVSKKIEDEAEKQRLRTVVDAHREEGMGFIVRTDAVGADEAALAAEIAFLQTRWRALEKKAAVAAAPCLLHAEDGLLLTVARDYLDDSVDRVIVNSRDAWEELDRLAAVLAPKKRGVLQFRPGDPFARAGISAKLNGFLQRKVWLNNGAYLVFDEAEALTAIDVNTGKFTGGADFEATILRTNLEAAREISRQLRLRAIGGIIVIDFIDMEREEDRETVLKALQDAVQNDKFKTNVIGFAPLGLVEVTRKRTRRPLTQTMMCACPYCEGDGRILNVTAVCEQVAQALARAAKHTSEPIAVLRINPYLLPALKEKAVRLRETFEPMTLWVRTDNSLHIEDFNVDVLSALSHEEGLTKL